MRGQPETAIVTGSVQDVANQSGKSVAEAFMAVEIVALVDTSASMSATDSRGGQSRYDVACDELRRVQADHPGKVGVIAFSSDPTFCPGGVPTFEGGSTNLRDALRFAAVADGCCRFVVISDGDPDDRAGALQVAKKLASQIDTIYVGPEGDYDSGKQFLAQLATSKGGRSGTARCGVNLGVEVERSLLLSAGTGSR